MHWKATVPGVVVGRRLSGHVDLRTAEEEEDDDADDESTARDDDQPDGADRRQLETRHDETAAEAAQRARQRPRQRCRVPPPPNHNISYTLCLKKAYHPPNHQQ